MNKNPINLVLDTDIGRDPDDALALLFLLSRPEVSVRAITIAPGDRDQVALARFLVRAAGHPEVPIGAVPGREAGKRSVHGCHLRLMDYHGAKPFADADGAGWEILEGALREDRDTLVLTTGPLDNVGHLLSLTDIKINDMVSMGGYWSAPGEPLVMPEFNFNGCPSATRRALASERVIRWRLVGKNITHGVVYDQVLHEAFRAAGGTQPALQLMFELMNLRSARSPKKLHDPVAAACAICEDLAEWLEVAPCCRGFQWGSTPQAGTRKWVATKFDEARFRQLFVGGSINGDAP